MHFPSRLAVLTIALMSAVAFAFTQELSDSEIAKLHPKFRVLFAGAAAGTDEMVAALAEGALQTDEGKLLYGAIVYTTDPAALRSKGFQVNAAVRDFVTVKATRDDLLGLARHNAVRFIEFAEVDYPATDVSVPETGAFLVHSGFLNGIPYRGRGAIVLIFDTGIDWRHHDFRLPNDTTKTRIIAIWDQTLPPNRDIGEATPIGFTYGVEYTKAHIEDEIDGTPSNFVRSRDINGHGTHVAGTAVGNGLALQGKYRGMAPEADILIVKGGDVSFPRDNQINALAYAAAKATKPIVVNMSIGGHSGPHDGTLPTEVAVDDFVKSPGRAVVISAGNDGDRAIHIDGSLALGASVTITVTVPTYTPTSGTWNDRFILDIWFNGTASGLRAVVTSPNGITVTRQAGETGTWANNDDGTIVLHNDTSTFNGHRNVYFDVHDADALKPPRTGTWRLVLSNISTTTTYDGWLASRTVGTTSVRLEGGNTQKTVAMPATSHGAISVGSYVTKWSWPSIDGNSYTYDPAVNRTQDISTFSSIGPTRDGRQKPDIAAPGQGIAAALSSNANVSIPEIDPSGKHYLTQGTSMAAPHVAGAAALLLGMYSKYSSSEIKNLLLNTANSDGFTGSIPNYTWGYGKLDMFEAMLRALYPWGIASRTTMSYAGDPRWFIQLPSTNQKFAVRFTPPVSGKLYSASVRFNSGANGVKGNGNLLVSAARNTSGSVGGVPGTQIGSSVSIPFTNFSAGIWNAIDLSSANVPINSGEDFHLVFEVIGGVGDTLQFLLDDGVAMASNRTSSYRLGVNGLGWYNRADPNYTTGWTPAFQNLLVTASIATVTSVERISEDVPSAFSLDQNYPNPFNPSTTIRYSIPLESEVKLRVYDLLGKEVRTLVNEKQSPGTFEVKWDGKNNRGEPLSSGIYFYRLESGSFVATKKLMLLK